MVRRCIPNPVAQVSVHSLRAGESLALGAGGGVKPAQIVVGGLVEQVGVLSCVRPRRDALLREVIPPGGGHSRALAIPVRIIFYVSTFRDLEPVWLSRAPPAIGGPWRVALASGSFGDPLRGQGAGRRSH